MSALRRRLAAVALAASVCATGCGDDPPTGPSGLAGAWTGTWRFISAGATVTDAVSATIAQNGANATGTWTATSGASGDLAFTTTGTISGSVTLRQNLLTGQVCTATASVTAGSVAATTIDLTLSDPPGAGLCQWATGHRFTLSR